MDAQRPFRIEKSIAETWKRKVHAGLGWLGGGFVCGVGKMRHPCRSFFTGCAKGPGSYQPSYVPNP